jgi:hypothetical protein
MIAKHPKLKAFRTEAVGHLFLRPGVCVLQERRGLAILLVPRVGGQLDAEAVAVLAPRPLETI